MSYLVCYTMCMMIKKATYTLWNGSQMIATYPHTREGMDAAMEKAHSLYVGGYGTLTLYSSRDDLVWKSTSWEDDAPECGMSDVEADADALASAGYGTDEDYGYYGE